MEKMLQLQGGFLPIHKWSYNPYKWPSKSIDNWGYELYNPTYFQLVGVHLVPKYFVVRNLQHFIQ